MKQSSKPMASPGRALVDKFPPPLMRFLRSNVGSKSTRSKSKSKSKARPLFFRRKKLPAGETQPEPSSPKVTCIGQVRVRRSTKKTNNNPRPRNPNTKNRCGFAGKCLCCPPVTFNTKKRFRFRVLWRKWLSFFCCRPAKVRSESGSKPGSSRVEECESRTNRTEVNEESESESESESAGAAAALKITPPKNAFLLTRCRSAPYRSSSLACRLWGSEEEGTETEAQKTEETVSVSVASEITVGIQSENEEEEKKEGEKEEKVAAPEPGPGPRPLLVVMRCRSEPARRGSERLDPLTSEFWRERRRLSNTTDDSSKPPHALC